jgi:cysteine sulfinate desulfinase/cysteine desulfurase-like protein
MIASTDAIRACFPALERTHNSHPVAYFDAPGGTQVPRAVAEAMTDYLFHHNANTHWAYPTSAETDAMIDRAREAAADLLNGAPNEIAFGNNMTTLTFHLARTLARTWQRGDEVVITQLDHHANVAPWRALERDFGIVAQVVRMHPETAQLDYEHMASLIGPKTRLVAVGGASNAVGTVNDLARVRSIAAEALMFVDAVHLTPHEVVDVQRIGCDFLACSSYKFYGPHAGILWSRGDLLASLPFPKVEPAPDTAPERAETGTQNHEGIAGIGARAARGASGWRRLSRRCTSAATRCCGCCGTGSRRFAGSICTARDPASRARRRSLSRSTASTAKRPSAAWPTPASSSATATSTRKPAWSAWGWRKSSASAVRATRRKRKCGGSWSEPPHSCRTPISFRRRWDLHRKGWDLLAKEMGPPSK